MSLRDTINRNAKFVAATVAVLLVAALGWYAFQTRSTRPPGSAATRQFLSTDEGKSWFLDQSGEFAPVQHDGAAAVEAVVFTCDEGKTRWAGYLRRYSPRGKEIMQTIRANVETGRPPEILPELPAETEVKLPGQADWIKTSDVARYRVVLDQAARCPHNGGHPSEAVTP